VTPRAQFSFPVAGGRHAADRDGRSAFRRRRQPVERRPGFVVAGLSPAGDTCCCVTDLILSVAYHGNEATSKIISISKRTCSAVHDITSEINIFTTDRVSAPETGVMHRFHPSVRTSIVTYFSYLLTRTFEQSDFWFDLDVHWYGHES